MIPAHVDISGLRDLLQKREVSSVELCEHFYSRIERHASLNAFVTLDRDGALETAADADRRLSAGDAAPLLGIPIAHKDIFCTKGMRTTCASKILRDFIPPYDAKVVDSLKKSGAVTLGKTNMDEFAMGSSSEHTIFGSVRNPWDTARVPGGSSGGSAAAVAAGLAPAATGTDTGGSIRQPAALCGVTGVKPSYGRVSRFGMIAFASSLDQAGVFTRSVRDAALMLDVIATHDPRDSTSLDVAPPGCMKELHRPIERLKIGVPQEFFSSGLDPVIRDAVHGALQVYESLGASLIDLSLPNCDAAIPSYYVIAPAEASSNLSRFDGVRYGYRAKDAENLFDMYRKTRRQGFGKEVQRRIMIGTYVLSHGYYDAYYLKAQRVRRRIAMDYADAFEKCDVIMGPTTPSTAFAIGSKTEDPVQMYLNDIYTASVNLAGLPAMSIPAGFDNDGLPVGLHIVGKYLQESEMMRAAHMYQQHTDHHQRTPELST